MAFQDLKQFFFMVFPLCNALKRNKRGNPFWSAQEDKL